MGGPVTFEPITFFASVCLGISLAASAGLRAFLPLLVTALGARFEWLPGGLSQSLSWLAETPALVALSIAVVIEVLADKVPALDHLLDTIQIPVRTAAGMLAFVAVVAPSSPGWVTALLSLVAGGAALSVHATKSFVRIGSTTATAGVANPVLSLFEDILCLVASVLSVLLWVFAAFVAMVALAWMVFGVRKLMKLRGKKTAPEACPTTKTRPGS
jgi:hypothetical protein